MPWKENMLTKRRSQAGLLRVRLAALAAEVSRGGVFDGWGYGRPKGGRVQLEKRRGATGAADAASLGLCGGLGLTRCGAMEEALTWAWCSGGGLAMAE